MVKANTVFRSEKETWKKFNEVCKKNDMTRGEVLREFMLKYIKQKK